MTREWDPMNGPEDGAMHHFSRRVLMRRVAAAGASAGALGILAACGSSAIEVSEEPTVTRIPVEGAPTDVPPDVEPGSSPAAGGQQVAEASPADDTAAAGDTADTADAGGGGETVELEGYDIGWTQETLAVPVGGTIAMYNSGAAEHNFAVEGYNDDDPVDLPVGGEVVEWQVPEDLTPGEYVFYCEVPGHRASGMEGVLTITEAGAGPPANAEDPQTASDQGVEGASTIQLEAYDIGWTQTELEVPSGGAIEMTNVGAAEHNFAIDEYQDGAVLQDIPIGGEPVTWQVPADLGAGTYTFFCEIAGHRQVGMEGTLTIV